MQQWRDDGVRMADEVEAALGGAGASPEAAALARIAREVSGLRVPGPDAAASARMRARFAAYMEGEGRSWRTWLLGWLGLGSERRPLVQRLAAGAVLVVAAAGGAQAAGVDTAGALRAAGEFAVNAVRNLDPGRDAGGPQPLETPADGGTPTREPGASPTPTGTDAPGAAGATSTPTPAPASPIAAQTPGPVPTSPAGPPPTATPTPSPSTTPAPGPTTAPGTGPTATPTPSPSTTPAPGPTTAPGTGPTATPTPTPAPMPTSPPGPGPTPTEEPDDDDDDDEGEETP